MHGVISVLGSKEDIILSCGRFPEYCIMGFNPKSAAVMLEMYCVIYRISVWQIQMD